MKIKSNKVSVEITPQPLPDGLWQAEWVAVLGGRKARHYSAKLFPSREAATRHAERAADNYLRGSGVLKD